MSLATPEKIRSLQRKLYDKAKGEPSYRFYSLYDKVHRKDFLDHAYRLARSNDGAPGVDGETFERIESHGLESWLGRLEEELRKRTYQPEAVRRVMIPKPGGGERPLGIPTIKDRVAQTAALLVLTPIFEAEFADQMYGYRPGRNAQQAVGEVHQALRAGYTEVVDADVSKYFDTVPHANLLKSVARRINDGAMLHLIKLWLKVPTEERDESGKTTRTGAQTKGIPQGGALSPLMANIYMNRFMRAWQERGMGWRLKAKVVNYADDLVILCRGGAEAALDVLRRWMGSLKLALNETKTCLKHAMQDRFDFLGYTFGLATYRPTGHQYLAAWPSRKAVARLREKVRGILRPGNKAPWPKVAVQVNRLVRGWANYFGYGRPARTYWQVNQFLLHRARRFLVMRHKSGGRGTRKHPVDEIFGSEGILPLQAPVSVERLHALA